MSRIGQLHHVEIRTNDLARAEREWGWVLATLGYRPFQRWDDGLSWALGSTYIVVESAPTSGAHDRRMPGLSHLALHAGTTADVEALWDAATANGWTRLYEDRHPWAGGEPSETFAGHYAAYLENSERFKIELVAET